MDQPEQLLRQSWAAVIDEMLRSEDSTDEIANTVPWGMRCRDVQGFLGCKMCGSHGKIQLFSFVGLGFCI